VASKVHEETPAGTSRCGSEAHHENVTEQSGFTLIEMIVVLAVVGTLAALITPRIFPTSTKRS
jgi:prepilin-type N-terminal cleavage/methylation domain-containing protein